MSNYFCTNTGCNPCQPQPCPPQPCQEESPRPGCACAEDFRKLLDLICGQQLRPLTDFATFAFISDYYLLGSTLVAPVGGTAPGDNLAEPAGTYVCGSNSCETLTVSGLLYAPEAGGTALTSTVTQIALCRLKAIVFSSATTTDADSAAMVDVADVELPYIVRTAASQAEVEAAFGPVKALAANGYLLSKPMTRKAIEAAGLELLAVRPVFS